MKVIPIIFVIERTANAVAYCGWEFRLLGACDGAHATSLFNTHYTRYKHIQVSVGGSFCHCTAVIGPYIARPRSTPPPVAVFGATSNALLLAKRGGRCGVSMLNLYTQIVADSRCSCLYSMECLAVRWFPLNNVFVLCWAWCNWILAISFSSGEFHSISLCAGLDWVQAMLGWVLT